MESAEREVALANTLTRQARDAEGRAAQARRERRAVLLRLHEDEGFTYQQIVEATGLSASMVHRELQRARLEREEHT